MTENKKVNMLLVILNESPTASHMESIKKTGRVIFLEDAPFYPDFGELQKYILQSSIPNISMRGPLGDSRYLMRLRDIFSVSKLSRFHCEILIYGGRSAQVMPQYYLFKGLAKTLEQVAIYSSEDPAGIRGFHDVLCNADFDGNAHKFVASTNTFGFQVLLERVDA